MTLSQPRDIEIINTLQVLNADEHLYFQDFTMRPELERLVRKHAGGRSDADRQVKKIENPENAKGGTYYMSSSSCPRLPGLWSFCSVRSSELTYPFGVRDFQLCSDLQEWLRDPNGSRAGKAFPDWMDEGAK
jgi:hypothetical protein